MSDSESIRAYLKSKRPGLREDFLGVGDRFSYNIPEFGFTLEGTQCSIYDENIDAMFLRSKFHGNIIVNNTYLASFAYNMALVWLNFGHEYPDLEVGKDCALSRLLRYNFKKFFSEQILNRTHNVFGIAIFLETLLYQEQEMRQIFDAAKSDPIQSRKFEIFANVMSGIMLFHEVGHLINDLKNEEFEKILIKYLNGNSQSTFDAPWKNYLQPGRTEFLCDAFAVIVESRQRPNFADGGFILRAIAFGFIVCACLSGLEKSAAATARQYPASMDPDILDEIHADLPGANFVIGIDESLTARAESVIAICHYLATTANIGLFQTDAAFPLPENLMVILSKFMLTIVDWDNSIARGLCELTARALHGNDRGIEYLKLRSKVFKMPPGSKQNPISQEMTRS